MRLLAALGIVMLAGTGMARGDDIVYWASHGTQWLAAGTTIAQLCSSNHEDRVFGSQMFRSLAYTQAATELLKLSTQQPRPRDRDADDGFPSGHAAFAFAFAETLSQHDSRWTIPAYTLAVVTGYQRIRDDGHYPLQVLAGAALGYFISQEVGKNQRWEW
ncbi:MAG: phosphatase PAP2 family protein [candidate division WS1 bacterium]|nr:phosphatase PAP2 family protein [candidate division WS1 bacterium]